MNKYFENPENVFTAQNKYKKKFFFFTNVRIFKISKIRTSGRIRTSGSTAVRNACHDRSTGVSRAYPKASRPLALELRLMIEGFTAARHYISSVSIVYPVCLFSFIYIHVDR